MNCTSCDAVLPMKARYCPACGVQVMLFEEQQSNDPSSAGVRRIEGQVESTPLPPQELEALRTRLIDCYVNFSMSKELSEWLQDLALPATGTMQEKLTRLRQHAGSLVLPAESVPRQIIWYLNRYDENILAEICEELGIDHIATKGALITRIYREVGTREGWLQPLSEDARQIITETFLPILSSMERKNVDHIDLRSELSHVLGNEQTGRHGPQANRSAIMAVLIPGLLQEAHASLFQEEFNERVRTGL